jgi:hypothetical protein
VWPFTKNKPKLDQFIFKLDDLTVDEKIDLLYDHVLLSKLDRSLPAIGTRLVLRINRDSTDILAKRSYFSKLEKVQ